MKAESLIKYKGKYPEKTNREIARAAMNSRVNNLIGLGLDDLADTCQMSNLADEIEGFLENGDFEGAAEAVNSMDMEFLEESEYN